ncbi:MAG: hypothetical protein KGS44_16235 [Alphaproteobacteria bacterium]|nr:hypothetical protein [Alphaproteobacteria bacterium]
MEFYTTRILALAEEFSHYWVTHVTRSRLDQLRTLTDIYSVNAAPLELDRRKLIRCNGLLCIHLQLPEAR